MVIMQLTDFSHKVRAKIKEHLLPIFIEGSNATFCTVENDFFDGGHYSHLKSKFFLSDD
jgi:hypothetical protein